MILKSEEPIPAQLQTAAASSSGSNTVSKEVEEEFKQLGLSLNFAIKWKDLSTVVDVVLDIGRPVIARMQALDGSIKYQVVSDQRSAVQSSIRYA